MKVLRRVLWSVLAVFLAVLISAGATIYLTKPFASPVEIETTFSDSRIITAIEKQEQIVLMSASVQGISTERVEGTIWEWTVPGTSRTQFLQYSYRAKLGIEGEDVSVEADGADRFIIHIPEFIFIGHSDEKFETVMEKNGALSFATTDIDPAKTITKILDAEAKTEEINANRDLLEEQAIAFYTGIITAIDPNVKLDFQFSN